MNTISSIKPEILELRKLPTLHDVNVVFNSNDFININGIRGLFSYSLESKLQGTLIRITFQIDKNEAVSLPGCPYAGLEISELIDKESAREFLDQVIVKLKENGIESIIIKQPPAGFFGEKLDNLKLVFENSGFVVKSDEVNHYVDLVNCSNAIHKMEKRKIEKCTNAGFTFVENEIDELGEVYNFIEKCRIKRGVPINISKEQLTKTFKTLPNHYKSFSVYDQSKCLMAAAVVVRINDNIVYNYLPAFDRSFSSFSPLAFLMNELYNYYRTNGVLYIDLGISSVNGKPQNGLIDFKERMGGIRSNRYTYTKSL